MRDTGIKLRAVEPEDAEFMFRAELDPVTEEYSDQTAPLSLELMRQYAVTYDADPFRSGQLRLIVEDIHGRRIGIADLFDISARHSRAECGLYIVESERGKGFGRKALLALKHLAVSRLGLSQLTATVAEENAAALATFKSAGFARTGFRPKWWRDSSGFHDVIILNTIL